MAEITTGAQWAIAELERLDGREEYHRALDAFGDSRALGITAVLQALRAGDPIALVMTRRSAAPPERMAILAAALGADAQAAVLESRLKAMSSRVADLDSRTLGLKRYGGGR